MRIERIDIELEGAKPFGGPEYALFRSAARPTGLDPDGAFEGSRYPILERAQARYSQALDTLENQG